jgi:phosphatidylinositol-3-phosphatase
VLLAGAVGSLLAAGAAVAASPIRHVFTIILENESASTTFGPSSPAPYLSRTLPSEGAYLPHYYGIGHESNDNYIAMIGGQAPNIQNQIDCQTFDDFTPTTIGAHGQVDGTGCVYPPAVQTIASQLTSAGFTWRDFDQSMGADPTREAAVCAHPAIGAQDNTEEATATDMYATRHNPFVYFHSIIDNTTLCDTHVVNLSQLPADLGPVTSTPNYVFITPDLCNDGHDSPCANGQPGGLTQANQFLQTWVPKITASKAFRENGLLIITFDEADTSDATSCCGEIPGPLTPNPGLTGPGGGDVGAVLLSPCIAPGTVSQTPYNHYTMLRSVEDIFGVSHLGYANLPGETSFGSDIFKRPCGAAAPKASINAPPLLSAKSSQAKITVRWKSTTTGGTSLAFYAVRVRDTSAKHPRWRTLQKTTKHSSLTYKDSPGHTYVFQVQAVNLAGQTSNRASQTTVLPSGVRPTGAKFSAGWKVGTVHGAWLGQAISSSTAGASLRLRYSGGALSVIGERLPRGGVAQITLDGHSHTVDLHASSLRTRRTIFHAQLRSGVHRLTIRVVSGTVALEGLAITARRS